MEKKRHLIRVLVLLIVFLLVGCKGKKQEDSGPSATISGSDGISMSFMKIVSDKVYSNAQMRVGVEVENEGTCDMGRYADGTYDCVGHIKMLGLDPTIFHIPDWDNGGRVATQVELGRSVFLPGKSNNIPTGGKEIITYPGITVQLNPESAGHKTNLALHACYLYKTRATIPVCIDPLAYGDFLGEKVCDVKPITLKDQGAPVAVVKVDPEVFLGSGNQYQMQFRIYFKNVGPGMLFQADRDGAENENLEACPAIDYDYQNKVKVDRIVLGSVVNPELSIPLICQPGISDQITLYDNQGLIICQTNGDLGQDTYQTTLFVELSYGYTQSIKKQITDVNTPTLQRANLN